MKLSLKEVIIEIINNDFIIKNKTLKVWFKKMKAVVMDMEYGYDTLYEFSKAILKDFYKNGNDNYIEPIFILLLGKIKSWCVMKRYIQFPNFHKKGIGIYDEFLSEEFDLEPNTKILVENFMMKEEDYHNLEEIIAAKLLLLHNKYATFLENTSMKNAQEKFHVLNTMARIDEDNKLFIIVTRGDASPFHVYDIRKKLAFEHQIVMVRDYHIHNPIARWEVFKNFNFIQKYIIDVENIIDDNLKDELEKLEIEMVVNQDKIEAVQHLFEIDLIQQLRKVS